MKQKSMKIAKSLAIIVLLISLPIAATAEIQVYDANDQYLGVAFDPNGRWIFIPSLCKHIWLIQNFEDGTFFVYPEPPYLNEWLAPHYDNDSCSGIQYFNAVDANSAIDLNKIMYDPKKDVFIIYDLQATSAHGSLYACTAPGDCECKQKQWDSKYYYSLEEIQVPFNTPIMAPLKLKYNQKAVLGPDNCE